MNYIQSPKSDWTPTELRLNSESTPSQLRDNSDSTPTFIVDYDGCNPVLSYITENQNNNTLLNYANMLNYNVIYESRTVDDKNSADFNTKNLLFTPILPYNLTNHEKNINIYSADIHARAKNN